MNRFRLIFCAASLCVVALFPACYHDQSPDAVEKARAFALEQTRDLSETDRNFIRYTEPEIYENIIYPHYQFHTTDFDHIRMEEPKNIPRQTALDYMHSCVVWAPPGLGAKVVVAGEGERSMRFWWPNRVIVKNYIPKNMELENASAGAVAFVMSHMLSLSDAERNRVRFAEPVVTLTRFDLEDKTNKVKEVSDWEAYMGRISSRREPVQVSLVWPADHKDQRIVITGTASDAARLGSFRIVKGRVLSADQLRSATLSPDEIKALLKGRK